MAAKAAGVFRRTPIERSDQRVAWERAGQAFFAAGACHILAWACRDSYPDFEGRLLDRVEITVDLADFCAEHNSRLPTQYWRDPLPRAHEYVGRYVLPWT